MTFIEAIQDIFRGDDMNKTLAIIALLAASFLLGLLLYWLFFSFPRNRRQKREISTLKLRNETLEKENKDLSERFTAQSQKMTRVEEDMRSVQNENAQKVKHIKNLDQRITDLEVELKASQALAQNVQNELAERIRMYKYAHAEALAADERAQAALQEREAAMRKVEEMKGLVEEVESEHSATQKKLAAVDANNQQLVQELEQAKIAAEELKKDLQAALEQLQIAQTGNQQLAELQARIEALQKQTQSDEQRIIELDALLTDMRHSEEQLRDQLEVYWECERMELQSKQDEDALFDEHLAQAARSIESHGIIEQTEEEMIEDPELLQRRLQADLQQQKTRSLPVMPPPVEIDEIEHEEMDFALSLAEQALEREGFYTEFHPHISMEQSETDETDDDIMNRSLEMAQGSLDEDGMFEKLDPSEFIEDADLLEKRMEEDKRIAATRPRALPQQEPEIEISDEENEQMERSLKLTQAILDSEGFYSYINPEKLIDNRALTEQQPPMETLTETPVLEQIEQNIPVVEQQPIPNNSKYKTEIEKSIAQELGKTVPMASPAMKDDLKKIEGIGTFIEQKLNHLGIYTYEQISRFDADFIQKIAAAIGFSEKTIYNDRWVEQAQKLMTQQEIQILTKDMNNVNKLFKKDK